MGCLPTYNGKRYKSLKELREDVFVLNKNTNAILDNRMSFDPVNIFNGRSNEFKGAKYGEQLSPKDFATSIIDNMFFDKLNRMWQSYSMVLDVHSDKTTIPSITFYIKDAQGKNENIVTKKRKGGYEVNGYAIQEIIQYNVEYYRSEYERAEQKLKDSGINLKKVSVEEVEASDLVKGKHYSVINGKVVPGPALTGTFENTYYTKKFIEGWDKADNKYEYFKEAVKADFENFTDYLDEIGYNMPERIKDIQGEYMQEDNWHPVYEGYFMLWHILQTQVSHITRGSQLQYKNIVDYIKRSAGEIAPGLVPNDRMAEGLPQKLRVLIMKDIPGKHRMFPNIEDPELHTNGIAYMLPVMNKLLINSTGGNSSPVGEGMNKPQYFYNDPLDNTALYLKEATLTIDKALYDNFPIARRRVETMLGEILWNKYKVKLNNNYNAAMQEIVNDVIANPELKNEMIFQIVHESAVKTGGRRINRYDEKDGDHDINPLLNNADNTIEIETKRLRIQQDSDLDIRDTERKKATQILNVVGALPHNQELIQNINGTISQIASTGMEKLNNEIATEGIIPAMFKVVRDKSYNLTYQTKFADLLSKGLAPEISRRRFIQTYMSGINNICTPEMFGQTYNQGTITGYIYVDERGNGIPMSEAKNLKGLKKERIRPMVFIDKDGNEAKSVDDLNDGEWTMRPADVFLSYSYVSEFGIDRGITLSEAMAYGNANMNNVSREEIEKVVNALPDTTFDTLPLSIQNAIKRRFDNVGYATMKQAIIDYYTELNETLDILSVRIPTSAPSSAFVGRVIGFLDSETNTIITSAEKSIIDGSDYDIDQLAVFFKGVDEFGRVHRNGRDGLKNQLFDYLKEYFEDSKNAKMIYSRIDLSSMRKKRDAVQEKHKFKTIGDAGTNLYHTNAVFEGKAVGHFATMEKLFLKLAHMPEEQRKLFVDSANIDFTDVDKVVKAVELMANLINAATDNANENILGPININRTNSNIILGMILDGMEESQILDAMKDPLMTDMYKRIIGKTGIESRRVNNWDVINEMLAEENEKAVDKKLRKYLDYAYTGEQMRRLGTILDIEKKIPSSTYDIYKFIKDVEFATGMLFSDLITNIRTYEKSNEKRVDNEVNYVFDEMYSFDSMKREPMYNKNDERKIRNKADLVGIIKNLSGVVTYLEVFNESYNNLKQVFVADNIHQSGMTKEFANRIGKDWFYFEDEWNAYEDQLSNMLYGQYIVENMGVVSLYDHNQRKHIDYNLKDQQERDMFDLKVPEYIRYLKANGYKSEGEYIQDNDFVAALNIDTPLNSQFEYVNFRNVFGLDSSSRFYFQEQYDMLPDEIKDILEAYQMTRNGFKWNKNSLSEVMGTYMEENFSEWYNKKYSDKNISKEDWEYFKENAPAYMQEHLSSSILGKRMSLPIYRKAVQLGKGSVQKMFDAKGNIVSRAFLNDVNWWGERSAISSYPELRYLQVEDLEMLMATNEPIEVRTKQWHGILDETRSADPIVAFPVFGKKAITPIGIPVELSPILNANVGTSYMMMRASNKILESRRKTKESVNRGSDFMEFLVRRLKKSFPLIRIEFVDDSNSKRPGRPGYVDKGTVYLNTDHVNAETPIHEIGHVVVAYIEYADPMLYQKLKSQALDMMDQGNEIAKQVMDAYSDKSKDIQALEVMALIIEMDSIDAVQRLVDDYNSYNSQGKAQKIWNTIKDTVQQIWRQLSAYFNNLFGIDTLSLSPDTTIYDLSRIISEGIKSGSVVSSVSSSDRNIIRLLSDIEKRPSISELKKQLGLGRKQISYQQLINAFKRIKKHNIEYGSKHYIKYKKVGQADLYEWELITHWGGGIQMKLFESRINNTIELRKYLYNASESAVYDELTTEQKINYHYNISRSFPHNYAAVGSRFDLSGDNEEQIKRIIRNEIVEKEEKYQEKFQSSILSFLNKGKGKNSSADTIFGLIDNEPAYSDTSLQKLRNALDYSESVKYVRLTELSQHIPGLNINATYFNDPDIIVGVEKVGEDYNLSIHKFTDKNMNDRGYAIEGRKNILAKDITDRRAGRDNIKLENRSSDIMMVEMSLLIQSLMKKNKNIKVHNSGIIKMTPGKNGGVTVKWNAPILMIEQLQAMGKVKSFTNAIDDKEIREIFVKGEMEYPNTNYEAILLNMYKEDFDSKEIRSLGMTRFVNGEISDVQGKVILIGHRMKQIKGTIQDHANNKEYKMLSRALVYLRSIHHVNYRMNTEEDIGHYNQQFKTQFDYKNDMHQLLRSVDVMTSRQIVDKLNAWKNEFEKHIEYMIDTTDVAFRVSIGNKKYGLESLKDISSKYFDRLIVKEEFNGEEFDTRYIYWTTDEKEDPLHAKKAKQLIADGKLDEKMLAAGRFIVDSITEQRVQTLLHEKLSRPNGLMIRRANGEKTMYNEEDARKELFEQESCGYVKGQIPIMTKSVGELMSSFKFGKAWKKQRLDYKDFFTLFSEDADLREGTELDDISDRFQSELGGEQSKYGNKYRRAMMGIQLDAEGKIASINKDVNSRLTGNLEMTMNYFMLSGIRKTEIEDKVLPLVNGIRTIMYDMSKNKDFDQTNNMRALEAYTERAIIGKIKKKTGKIEAIKASVEPTAMLLSGLGSFLTIAYNMNVAIVGGIANTSKLFVETLANSMVKNDRFGISDLTKAIGFMTANKNLVKALGDQMHIMSMGERDIISHQLRNSTVKHIWTRFGQQFMNWGIDRFSRSMVMVAMLQKEGSLKAYKYNKEKGIAEYNQEDDLQFRGEKGKARLQHKIELFREQGMEDKITADGKGLLWGHTYREMDNIKVFADSYIVGAYDYKSVANATNDLGGRLMLTYRNYIVPMIQNMVQQRKYVDKIGKYITLKDPTSGEWITKWEKGVIEGQLNTYIYFLGQIRNGKGIGNVWRSLEPDQKYNFAKLAAQVTVFTIMYMLYAGIKGLGKDDYDYRLTRNLLYAASELFVIGPEMLQWVEKPIIMGSIWHNLLQFDIFGKDSGEVFDEISRKVPGGSTIRTVGEIINTKE